MRIIEPPDVDGIIREIVADPEAFVRETRRRSARLHPPMGGGDE